MENTLKLLSHNKDCRIVLTNTTNLSSSKLIRFKGGDSAKKFLNEMITTSILFSGTNDFKTKTSFKFKLNKELTAYCLVEDGTLRLEYSSAFETIKESPDHQFTLQSTLSITIGDFSGLHTSTVLAQKTTVCGNLNFFTKQSDQLPAEFILSHNNPSIGVVLQPLPFADVDSIRKIRDTLAERIDQLHAANWTNATNSFSDIGKLLWEKKVE